MSNDAKREPFCWLEKRKLRNIAEVFAEGRLGSLAAARSVILALSEIASDKQSDTFTAATSYIAHRAGVTSKTVRRMIKTFKRLRFLRVQPRSDNGLKVANEYTLIRGNTAMGLIYPSLGKAYKTGLRTREESSEQFRESTARKGKDSLSTNGKRADQNEENIVIHARTGERFNKRTKEFVW
jgi:hypothetical protein